MNPIQSGGKTELRSISTSVMKMELDQSKLAGQAQQELISGAGDVAKHRPPAANGPGVGTRVDVSG